MHERHWSLIAQAWMKLDDRNRAMGAISKAEELAKYEWNFVAEAWKKLLSMKESERKSLGVRARQRIIDHYSLDKMTASYCQLYRDIITGVG